MWTLNGYGPCGKSAVNTFQLKLYWCIGVVFKICCFSFGFKLEWLLPVIVLASAKHLQNFVTEYFQLISQHILIGTIVPLKLNVCDELNGR